jgi:hypothetical protein
MTMLARRSAAILSGSLLLVLLAGCATPPPPVTSLEGRICATRLDLGNPRPLALAGGAVKVTLEQTSPCLEAAGAKSAYLLFRLPESADEYMVSVSSAPLGQGLFAPHLLLLGDAGQVQRQLSRDSFMFHGAALAINIRIHPGEHFLVVASDSDVTGQQISRLVASTQVATYTVGLAYVSVHTGAENTSNYTYAYNGVVTVAAEKIPKAN